MEDSFILSTETDILNSLTTTKQKIHIRIKQRNMRKCITTIENINSEFDLPNLVKNMRKKFNCIGSIKKNDHGSYIELSGDQRMASKHFLMENGMNENNIVIHGY